MLLTVVVALAAPLIAPYDPDAQESERLLPPSWTNLMGTDELGRDTFSRIVFGARVSLQVGIISVFIACSSAPSSASRRDSCRGGPMPG